METADLDLLAGLTCLVISIAFFIRAVPAIIIWPILKLAEAASKLMMRSLHQDVSP